MQIRLGAIVSLLNCKECGQEISSKADKCPHCGFKQKKSKKTLIIVIIIFVILWIIYTAGKINELYKIELRGLSEPKTMADSLYNKIQFNSKKINNFKYLDLRFEEKKSILLDQIIVTALFIYFGKDERKIRIAKLYWEMLELTIQREIINSPDSYQNKQLQFLLKKHMEYQEEFLEK